MKPVCVSTWHLPGQKYFDAFLRTARRNGIEPQNADESKWAGTDWTNIEWFRKTESQFRFIKDHAHEYTHFLFCDSYDVVFAAGWDEIMQKYEAIGAPIVFGAECCPWPKAEQASMYPETPYRCKYLNAGFWMGKTDAALRFLEDISLVAARREQCDQGIAVDMFLSKRHPIALDNKCSLCFCCNLNSLDYLYLIDERPRTRDTEETPCLFHGNGASPLQGIIESLDKVQPNRWVPTEEEKARMAE